MNIVQGDEKWAEYGVKVGEIFFLHDNDTRGYVDIHTRYDTRGSVDKYRRKRRTEEWDEKARRDLKNRGWTPRTA